MKFRNWIAITILVVLSALLLKGIALAQGPEVTTNAATDVTAYSATLNGNLTTLGSVYVWFEYATDAFYTGNAGTYSNATDPQQMIDAGPFYSTISGLSSNTTYHFVAMVLDGDIRGNGTDMTFTTGTPPVVTTSGTSNVTSNSAILNGNLTSLGDASMLSVSFEWGLTLSYGNETTAGNMSGVGTFSANLSSLDPDTTYHFRAKASGDGNTTGSDMTFTTASAVNLEGWGWCTNYNQMVAITFDGYTTMVQRANATDTYSMHMVGNLTLPAPYNETISLDMYGNRVRLLFYLRQEMTGKSVSFEGTWMVNATGNETYIGMSGFAVLPNPQGEALKTARICFAVLRTPTVGVPLTEPGSFAQDLDSMLSRFVKFVDKTLDTLVGSGFAGILSEILQRIAVLLAHLRALGTPFIP